MSPVFLALDALVNRFVNAYKLSQNTLPPVDFDVPGDSPCVDLPENEGHATPLFWRPVERGETDLFAGLEKGLEREIPQDLSTYYGAFWSNMVRVRFQDGDEFELIQLWNEDDEERLKENMLGHVFAKRKNRLDENFFIACNDNNEVACMDLKSGSIVLEKPGFAPHRILAPNLESFLLSLEPVV